MKNVNITVLAVFLIFSLSACNNDKSFTNTDSPGTESTSGENSPNIDEMTIIPGPSVETVNAVQNEFRSMTVDDVRAIARDIGPNFTLDDLSEYAVDYIEDGYYGYRVVGGVVPYNLLVASVDNYTVISAMFYDALIGGVRGNTSEFIDIRYYDIDKFIADGKQELALPFLEAIRIVEENIIGTWSADIGSIIQFFDDGTGRTTDDAGEHEFTWETFCLIEAAVRRSAIHSYVRTVYGYEFAYHFGEAGWGTDKFLLSLTFSDIPVVFDFPFVVEEKDTLTINTMNLGQVLSPTQDLSLIFEWITLSRDD